MTLAEKVRDLTALLASTLTDEERETTIDNVNAAIKRHRLLALDAYVIFGEEAGDMTIAKVDLMEGVVAQLAEPAKKGVKYDA